MTPTIIFVPGIWEGPTVFSKVTSLLQSQGYTAQTASLVSTGTTSPGNPSMSDDIASIRSTISKAVEAGQEVLLVLHSAGGFLGSAAIEGLTRKARKESELKGGVVKILFLAAGAGPKGWVPPPLPFMDVDHVAGVMTCKNPRDLLFHDLNDEEAEKWVEALGTQPAADWDEPIAYCGWTDVPSVYLVCEKDRLLPVEEFQLLIAGMAESKIVRCEAGHMVMLSMPEKVVEVVREALEGV